MKYSMAHIVKKRLDACAQILRSILHQAVLVAKEYMHVFSAMICMNEREKNKASNNLASIRSHNPLSVSVALPPSSLLPHRIILIVAKAVHSVGIV